MESANTHLCLGMLLGCMALLQTDRRTGETHGQLTHQLHTGNTPVIHVIDDPALRSSVTSDLQKDPSG